MFRSILMSSLVALSLIGCAAQRAESAGSAGDRPSREAPKEEEQKADSEAPLEVVVKKVANPGPRKRVGIMDFEDASHAGWGNNRNAVAIATRDAVSEALLKSGAFVVIEREQIAKVLGEQALGQSGAISQKSAAKAGAMLGLQAIVTGKIT